MSTNRKPRPPHRTPPQRGRASPQRGRTSPRQERTPPRRTGPRPPGETLLTPGASPFRRAVERRSAVALLWLYQAPRWIVPVAMVALLLAGAAAPRWVGALAFLTLAALLSWLCFLSWPTLQPRGQVLRTAAVVVTLAAAAGRGSGIL